MENSLLAVRDINHKYIVVEWIQIIQKWEGYVRKVVDNKGKPPMLY